MTRARDNATQGGLVLVNTTTFTSVASVAVDNIFTSVYTNYKIIFQFSPTTNDNRIISMVWRTSGVDNGSSTYSVVDDSANAGGGTTKTTRFFGAGGATSMQLLQNAYYTTARYGFDYDILNPQLAQRTMVAGNNIAGDAANYIGGNFTGYFDANTVFDGFKISSSVANITGTLKIYGYK